MRTRHENDPFISTQQMPSAVSVIHMASLMRPVASPHMMGSVPDKAMRIPQLIIGSKLSFWISWLMRLYGLKYATWGKDINSVRVIYIMFYYDVEQGHHIGT